LPVWRNLFLASGMFCSGRYQPGCTGIFWPVEGTSQLSLFLKSEKIPALLYVGKGPEYMAYREFRPAALAYRPRAQILNHSRPCTLTLLLYKQSLLMHVHSDP
jgi:hypothetical protein